MGEGPAATATLQPDGDGGTVPHGLRQSARLPRRWGRVLFSFGRDGTARRGHLDQAQEPPGAGWVLRRWGICAEVLSVLAPHPPSAAHARNETGHD